MSARGPIAVVDMGTNSTRLLVAKFTDAGGLHQLERRSEVTHLGEGVDGTGRLADAAMERVFTCLAEFRTIADRHGVGTSVAVATSAVRDAENGPEFQEAVHKRFGFEVAIISGDEEARLTFLGATAGRPGPDPTLVVDIGGGSTEFVIGTSGSAPAFHVSTHLGSVRQSERHLASDPPSHPETEALGRAVRQIIFESIPEKQRRAVGEGVAVAGTATSLAAIDQALDPYDPERVHGYRLVLGECERMLAMLATLPLQERKQIPGLHPERATTIVAGAVILVEAMRAFGLEQIEVSEADILQGVALDALAERVHE